MKLFTFLIVLVLTSSCCKMGPYRNAVLVVKFENYSIDEVTEISNKVVPQGNLEWSITDNISAITFEFLNVSSFYDIHLNVNDSTTYSISNIITTDLDDNNGKCDGGKEHQLALSFKYNDGNYEASQVQQLSILK